MMANFLAPMEFTIYMNGQADLWQIYFSNRTIENRNEIVKAYYNDLVKIINTLANTKYTNIEYNTLLSDGHVALIKAVEEFDPEKSEIFLSFLRIKIRGQITSTIRSSGLLNGDKRMKRLKNGEYEIISIDSITEDGMAISEVISDKSIPIDNRYIDYEGKEIVMLKLKELSKRFKKRSRIFLYSQVIGLTTKEISNMFNIKEVSVIKSKKFILDRLKESLSDEGQG